MASTTIVTRLPTSTGDNDLPLFCKDPSAQSKGTTDFCFDFRTLDQFAAGAIPAAGTSIPDASFVNLALNKSPILGRTSEAKLEQSNPANTNRNTADGFGLAINNGYGDIYNVRRSGKADALVGEVKDEGFRSCYFDVWTRLRAIPSDNAGIIGRGSGATIEYGIMVGSGGQATFFGLGGSFPSFGVMQAGVLAHLGFELSFDTAGDTAGVRAFRDGAEIGSKTALTKPSSWAPTTGGLTVGVVGGYAFTSQTLGRLTRTFTVWPGQEALDPLRLHQDEERYNRSRLA